MRACINNQQIRHHNKCVILELLYRQKRANKSTLARLAQISIPAVSNILQELESEKRVVNIDDESHTRGHSSGTWLIAPEGDWTLCLNVTPTSIECQVANACLSPKGEFEYLQIDAPTPQALLSEIEKCWHRHRKLWPDRTINLALAISAALNGLRWVSLAALAACVVWVVLRLKQGGRAGLQLSLAAVSAALYLCAQITLVFQESGIRMLFWLVPAWAALALVYYLYQREFFLSALVSGVGVLGLWFVRHAGASSFYTIGAVAVILVLAVMMLWLKGHGGRLFSGEAGQLLPEEAGYPLMLLSCVISLAAIAIAAFVGGALSYYLLYAMVAWLFALLVYYTVKMM